MKIEILTAKIFGKKQKQIKIKLKKQIHNKKEKMSNLLKYNFIEIKI